MIIEESPLVIFIPENNRQPGISAFMRIKNGEDYLKATILSIIIQKFLGLKSNERLFKSQLKM